MNSKHSSDVVCLVCVRFLVLTEGEGYTFARQQNNSHSKEIGEYMEDGGVDTTVIDSRQYKMGQMADFLPLLASSVFDEFI